MRKCRVLCWHGLYGLNRISLQEEEGIVESGHTPHHVAECIINGTKSWKVIVLQVYGEAQSHGTRLASKIIVTVPRQLGQLGICSLASLHSDGTEGVNRRGVL